jgi:hypothetical protein
MSPEENIEKKANACLLIAFHPKALKQIGSTAGLLAFRIV